jgi:diguanylate cyclase (GGDEF)-like protein
MDRLLRHIDLMTRQRDRGRLEAALVTALHELAAAEQVCLHKLHWSKEDTWIGLAVECGAAGLCQYDDGISGPEGTSPLHQDPLMSEYLRQAEPSKSYDAQEQCWLHGFVVGRRKTMPFGILRLERGKPLSEYETRVAEAFITVFDNCCDLLDYSEIDTLTGLLNRKTFDDYLYKILSRTVENDDPQSAAGEAPRRRRPCPRGTDHWTGVIDIDHFKRINDGFGHMIGDEVLLMLANRMKAHFRAQDKLFRFGGEEFVLLLKPTEIENAHSAFERFRQTVEGQEFPQVGRVTISIGYARLGITDEASAVLQNADRALYWAKEHGRNQVCSYEQLIARGELQHQDNLNSEVELF